MSINIFILKNPYILIGHFSSYKLPQKYDLDTSVMLLLITKFKKHKFIKRLPQSPLVLTGYSLHFRIKIRLNKWLLEYSQEVWDQNHIRFVLVNFNLCVGKFRY